MPSSSDLLRERDGFGRVKGPPATFRSLERANEEIGTLRATISWLHRSYGRRLIEERARCQEPQ